MGNLKFPECGWIVNNVRVVLIVRNHLWFGVAVKEAHMY